MGCPSPARGTEGIREIVDAAERSAHLTQQLLTFARKQPVSPRILELNTVVNGMLDSLIGENITMYTASREKGRFSEYICRNTRATFRLNPIPREPLKSTLATAS
jgi:hypothetical protein